VSEKTTKKASKKATKNGNGSKKTEKKSEKKDERNVDNIRRESDEMKRRLVPLLRHIKLVQGACELLGMKLIDEGENRLGRDLIAKSMLHDNSKFFGIEWEMISTPEIEEEDKDKKKELEHKRLVAIVQHQSVNDHHPEFYPNGVDDMNKLATAEMVCDWYARSHEFGTSLRDWIKDKALERWKISPNGKKYKEIKYFVDLLLEKPFS
tara:strand:+ start:361 stop:984 length:624 start_codon:yes stop_codon:yes gene_type:complete